MEIAVVCDSKLAFSRPKQKVKKFYIQSIHSTHSSTYTLRGIVCRPAWGGGSSTHLWTVHN